jgi:hypothetical protein
MVATRFTRLSVALAALGCAWGCGADVEVGSQHRTISAVDSGRPAEVVTDASPPDAGTCQQTACRAQVYDCGDCEDNDADGLVDMDDPDCVGPCHNAEDTFFGSIPGQNQTPCVGDCYFDADSGGGNDRCLWNRGCDPLAGGPSIPPEGAECPYDPDTLTTGASGRQTCDELLVQPVECLDACGPLVPNGCDCFGCCVIPGAPTPVWLGSSDGVTGTCSLAAVGDPERCHPCTQVPSCTNACEDCELCVGKLQLPAGCEGSGDPSCSTPACRPDQQPCGSDCLHACPARQACITGCCVEPPR